MSARRVDLYWNLRYGSKSVLPIPCRPSSEKPTSPLQLHSCPARELPCFGCHPDFFSFFNIKWHPYLCPGLQLCRFGHASARRISAHTWLRICHHQLHLGRQFQSDRVAVVHIDLHDRPFDQQVQRVFHHLARQRQRLKALLVQEVRTVAVTVEIRGVHRLQVRLLKLVSGLEGLVEDRAFQHIAHPQPHHHLPATRRRRRYLRLHAVIGSVFKLKRHLPLHINRINQCGHHSSQ